MEDNDRKAFWAFCEDLNNIDDKNDENYNILFNNLLDSLNSLDYSRKLLSPTEGEVPLLKCVRLMPVLQDDLLTSKLSQLILNIVAYQQSDLSCDGLNELLQCCYHSYRHSQAWVYCDVIRSIAALLYENGPRCLQWTHSALLGPSGILLQLIQNEAAYDIRRASVQCLTNICMRSQSGEVIPSPLLQQCLDVFLRILQTMKPDNIDDITFCRMIVTCLRGVHCVVNADKSLHKSDIGPLLAALKVYCLCGLSGRPVSLPVPSTLYPSQYVQPPSTSLNPPPSIDPLSSSTTSTKKPRRKQRSTQSGEPMTSSSLSGEPMTSSSLSGQPMTSSSLSGEPMTSSDDDKPWHRLSSSESDYSDTEGGHMARIRSFTSKVRLNALLTLHTVVKQTDRKIMFGYWSSFLPDTPSPGVAAHTHQTLFTSILRDPLAKGRAGGLNVLCVLLDGSKQFLLTADDRDEHHQRAFTPLNLQLAFTVREIHRCLLLALSAENSTLTLVQIIKCLSLLVANSPYQKLKPGLLTRLINDIHPFLTHRDHNVRVACFTCIGAMASITHPLEEVYGILSPSRYHATVTDQLETVSLDDVSTHVTNSSSVRCWVVRLCCDMISNMDRIGRSEQQTQPQPLPVRLEALQLLTAIAKTHFTLISQCLPSITQLINDCILYETDPSVKLHTTKLIEETASSLLQLVQNNLNPTTTQINKSVQFWCQVLDKPLPSILQSTNHSSLKSCGCDCLSVIGGSVLSRLPRAQCVMCVTMLLGLAGDEDRAVKGAAVRALGVFISYPCLRRDPVFISDVAMVIIRTVCDSSLNVRIKSAWALANLSDSLVTNREELCNQATPVPGEDLDESLELPLFELAIKCSGEHDKIRSNGVRALGNLLRCISVQMANRHPVLTQSAISTLTSTCIRGAVKVRWNACYAVGNVLHNTLLISTQPSWLSSLYTTLNTVILNCTNFKVRINASLALSAPTQRCFYDNQYLSVWESVVGALLGSAIVQDYTELKHQQSLRLHLCLAMAHLTCLLTVGDIRGVIHILKREQQTVLQYTYKVLESLYREDTDNKLKYFHRAEEHVELLSTQTQDTSSFSLSLLRDIFKYVVIIHDDCHYSCHSEVL